MVHRRRNYCRRRMYLYSTCRLLSATATVASSSRVTWEASELSDCERAIMRVADQQPVVPSNHLWRVVGLCDAQVAVPSLILANYEQATLHAVRVRHRSLSLCLVGPHPPGLFPPARPFARTSKLSATRAISCTITADPVWRQRTKKRRVATHCGRLLNPLKPKSLNCYTMP